MTTSVCPCDNHDNMPGTNPPGLPRISARRGDWRSIRRMLLTGREGEAALLGWLPGGTPDLALMIAEWWATLGEVLEFYNDEIANEAFLGTATRRESVARLIALLGYRPRPALAATAILGAMTGGRESITLPRGYAIESIPGPGEQPQTFELDADTKVAPGSSQLAQPAARLASPESGVLLLEGKVRDLIAGTILRLRLPTTDRLLTVTGTEEDGGVTRLSYTGSLAIPADATARNARLERPAQSLPVWTFKGSALIVNELHLAALTRAVTPGDSVLLTAPGKDAILSGVTAAADVIWYANPPADDPAVSPGDTALPVPHTKLTLSATPNDWTASTISVGLGWVGVALLRDQPPAAWTGTPATLSAIDPPRFTAHNATPILIADAHGEGVPASLTSSTDAAEATVTIDPAYASGASLDSPLNLLNGLLPVTRGKTVAREVLGSGEARIPGQSFPLAKAPLSYRRKGAGYESNLTLWVDNIPWTEVESFYGQPATASIFTLTEREDGKTIVSFGDGVNGRRLPTGRDNIIARYRYGAGASSPPMAKLTRLPSSWPGLAKVLNPVAAGGGADAEPADAIARYAPRSVLTLGRAVSVADYGAFAAAAAAPNRTRTVWAWDETRQRTAVTIYVAGEASVRADVRKAVEAVGDPHRPITVGAAEAIPILLYLSLSIKPGYESAPIIAAAREALTGPNGLFSAARLGIGQPLFTSAISEALLSIPGLVTILNLTLVRFYLWVPVLMDGTLHVPEDHQWFELSPDLLWMGCEVANG